MLGKRIKKKLGIIKKTEILLRLVQDDQPLDDIYQQLTAPQMQDLRNYLEQQIVHFSALRDEQPLTVEAIKAKLPVYALERYAPAKRMDEEGFGEPTGGALEGAVFWPDGGYVNDPALSAQNLAEAAKAASTSPRLMEDVESRLLFGWI